jgi:hypothetical protein
VIEFAPNEAYVWHSLSHWLSNRLKRCEDAEAADRKAIELNQNIAELTELWGGLAQLLTQRLKRYEEFEAKNSFLMRFRSLPTIPLFRAWTSPLAALVRQCVDCCPLSCFLLEPRPRRLSCS